jgi:hypothetical protein
MSPANIQLRQHFLIASLHRARGKANDSRMMKRSALLVSILHSPSERESKRFQNDETFSTACFYSTFKGEPIDVFLEDFILHQRKRKITFLHSLPKVDFRSTSACERFVLSPNPPDIHIPLQRGEWVLQCPTHREIIAYLLQTMHPIVSN